MKTKYLILIISTIACILRGAIFPIFSIFLAKMLTALLVIYVNPNDQDAIDDVNLYALIFLLLGVACFIFSTLEHAGFFYLGEYVMMKLRLDTLKKLLIMPVPWLERP